jgi:hypothetical protein
LIRDIRGRFAEPIVECREHRDDELIPSRIGSGREHDPLRALAAPRDRTSSARDCIRAKHRDRRDPIAERSLMRLRLLSDCDVSPLFECTSHTLTNAILKQGSEEREQVHVLGGYAENNLC